MPYAYLAAAIVFEILGTIGMKYADGFTRLIPSVLMVLCFAISFFCITFALKTLPVSLVYAIWAGVGTAIMAVVGLVMFNEPLPIQKVVATSLIILGVVMLNFSGQHAGEQVAAETEVKEMKRVPSTTVVNPSSVEMPGRTALVNRNSG
ncbi:QacE family quaternary ammonium compound efflux SMR transporter [Bdellovibrio sp. ZAP7]|uniref:DMT family transporter n=1 Tax=Bdellovibrio sp. ZAP7 TaxID=2231053 RepID=UPI001159142A|nr:multidrug efflux SMR transporter [Bdellovibrio sp. ZAP7]QDK45393.1 QacE family quaternary ammonium compound efflux SMR transporter [Bdellovibrio sp. ZAP7]